MRISDWSSDVCSSDLAGVRAGQGDGDVEFRAGQVGRVEAEPGREAGEGAGEHFAVVLGGECQRGAGRLHVVGGARDRKSVVYGKSVAVRVDLGGGRTIKKK